MEIKGYKIEPRTLVTSPNFILRIVCLVFCIIILACISRDGYFGPQCLFYSGGSGCGIGLAVSSLGLIFCLVFLAIDAIFLSIPQQMHKKYIVLVDLGFCGVWSVVYFVTFCYLANQWQRSDAKDDVLKTVNLNNIRASIAFAFFSIFSWGCLTYTAYLRRQSTNAYNQYADDVVETGHGFHGGGGGPTGEVPGSGYIDYYNDPSNISGGFDAGREDFDAPAGPKPPPAGDSDLLAN